MKRQEEQLQKVDYLQMKAIFLKKKQNEELFRGQRQDQEGSNWAQGQQPRRTATHHLPSQKPDLDNNNDDNTFPKNNSGRRQLIFSTENLQRTRQQLDTWMNQGAKFYHIELVCEIWKEIKRKLPTATGQPWNPLEGLSFLSTMYAPTTAYTYAKTIRRFHPDDFSTTNALQQERLKQVMKQLETKSNLSDKKAAAAATPAQVRNLIGNLSSPEQRTVYQLWTTASRSEEARNWTPIFHSKHKMVQLESRWSKSDPEGRITNNKWAPANSLAEAMLYQRTEVSYHRLLNYIKSKEPTLSCHSFRRGGIQQLQREFDQSEICLLTWHNNPSINRGMLPYTRATPVSAASKRIAELVHHLQVLVQ